MLRAAPLLILLASVARAEPMIWLVAESRVPFSADASAGAAPESLRLYTETRLAPTTNHVDEVFFRVGPIWELHEYLFLAAHGTAVINDAAAGPANELRLELEPNLRGRLGQFTFNDRNRLEYRLIDDESRFRYRNQFRLNWAPEGAKVMPFLSEEMLIDLSGLGFNQNRLIVGVGFQVRADTRLDAGYLLRSRYAANAWAHDHAFWAQLVYTPKAP